MSIKIPVSADLNTGDMSKQVEAMRIALNRMGAEAQKTGKIRFEPVTKTSVDEMRKANKEFEQMLKISGGLRKNLGDKGQGGKGWHEVNWKSVFPNDNQRQMYMHTLLKRMRPGTTDFLPEPAGNGSGPGSPDSPHRPHRHAPLGGGRRIINQVAGAGLRATGAGGSVAAGALETGMVSGAGAGVAGLLGGMLALGVGKVVGAAIENLDKAQNNEVAYDKLKRTIGDVNVSFGGLREVVKAAANDTRTTFDEATALSTRYARDANIGPGGMGELGGAMNLGVGLSRVYGLDPSQGMGALGQMRGVGVTRNESESRKFALLLGETISKSRSFAKADEVIQSLAGYAMNQSRSSLSANTEGYAGALTGLLAGKTQGLDVTGATNMLNRVNASVSAGGAYGEASQFFTARMGANLGLDPLKTRMLVEGGAFNTLDKTFGSGTIASQYGIKGGSGNQTVLEMQLAQMRNDYGGQSPQMLLEATKNHFGLQSMNQAGALLNMRPGDMGRLSKFANGKNLNGEGIGNLAMSMFGSDSDREGIYRDLSGRTGADALSSKERERLENAKKNGGDDYKEVLAELAASRGQEATQGKDIRDSRALLDNIKTDVASKLIPAIQSMRDGIVFMAGAGKMTGREISQRVAKTEHDEKMSGIKGSYAGRIAGQQNIIDSIMGPEGTGLLTATPDQQKALTNAYDEQQRLIRERDGKLSSEGSAYDANRKNIDAAANADAEVESRRQNAIEAARSTPGGNIPGITPQGGITELFAGVIGQETGGKHTNADGSLVTSSKGAQGISQLMPGTMRDPGFGVTPARNGSREENLRFGRDYLGAMMSRYGGDRQKALAAYNAGPGRVDSAVGLHGNSWLQHMPAETRHYVPTILGKVDSQQLPASHRELAAGGQAVSVTVDPITVQHQNERGQEIQAPQSLNATVSPARPFNSQ